MLTHGNLTRKLLIMRRQIYGQQDRYVLSLTSSSFLGGYRTSAKVHLPPSDYTYSDTGMFFDEDAGTWYLLTSADHNTIQINELEKTGKVGKRISTLSTLSRNPLGYRT